MHSTWMLYGANGYTGRLIADVAHKRGIRPILAGRNRDKITALAAELSMEARVFALGDMACNLHGVAGVLLAAGPFAFTSEVAVEACLSKGVHYLDITGEIEVYEALHGLDARAKAAGIVVLPGVGFDVVPTDCLAKNLQEALPTATELELAFSGAALSPGTMKTMLLQLGRGGAIRKQGRIVRVPVAYDSKNIDFFDKTRTCMTIPWGDVSTAYYSTGIPNIRVYTGARAARVRGLRLVRHALPILRIGLAQNLLRRWVESNIAGPTQTERETKKVELWGQVRDEDGRTVTATLTVPEAYSYTAKCAVEAIERVTNPVGNVIPPGFQTPSLAFGATFAMEFPGCTLRLRE